VSGPTFYQLHLLLDKHFNEQNELVDRIAERIMLLGGVSVAMSADVAEMTLVISDMLARGGRRGALFSSQPVPASLFAPVYARMGYSQWTSATRPADPSQGVDGPPPSTTGAS
jgi:hypothetical protein